MDEICFELVFSEENDDHGNCLTDLPTLFRFIPFDNFKTELEDKDELTKPESDWLSLPNIIIKKEKFLGGGMWGSVFSCKFKDTDEQVIVKVANRRIYKYSSEFSIRDSVESLLDELNALKTIEHLPPHCDIIFPSFINQGYILIKTTKEYVRLPTIILKCPIGEPLKFQPEISISERKELAKNITTKIIEALKPIHELGYLHGDISSSNLLVLKDKFILIDWGLSHHYLECDYINGFDYSALIKSTYHDYKGLFEIWRFIVYGQNKINEKDKDDIDYISIQERLESWKNLNYNELLSLKISSII